MDYDRLGMLCDIGELHAVLAGSADIDTFLQQLVVTVSSHMHVDVCSIYLFDASEATLTLVATHGLNSSLIGQVSLRLGEGLVGSALKEMRAISVGTASGAPQFKYIPGLDEERFESFLAVPIMRGIERVGVLVVQREECNRFDNSDVLALRAVTSQLAGAVENARMFVDLHKARNLEEGEDKPAESRVISAEVAAEGFALAPASIVKRMPWRDIFSRQVEITGLGSADLKRAVQTTETQLDALQTKVDSKLNDVASLIFDAQLFLLKDPEFVGAMCRKIDSGVSATDALAQIASEYITMFERSANAYMREKAKDVEDLAVRLLRNLVGVELKGAQRQQGHIVIAPDLYPSDILKLCSEDAAGIVLTSGGVTSHLSFLARSLGLPMLIVDDPMLDLRDGTELLLDAHVGNLYVNPEPNIVAKLRKHHATERALPDPLPDHPTQTRDGAPIRLLANINLLSDVQAACQLNVSGIGLYRTEFPFMVRSNFPSEEEQILVYSRLFEQMQGKAVTIRTLDVGGDKMLAYYDHTSEQNPTLGLRSIRFSLRHREVFHQQIRAILRAGAGADDLRIMFPMISSVDEFEEARSALHHCLAELDNEGLPHHSSPRVGMMVEIPSVVDIIDALAQRADFFCIGTNDFVQFMLAVDRANAKVSGYYLPHHPAVLRALKRIIDGAHRYGIEASICGEMAHNPRYIPFLLGIGVRAFSVDPRLCPRTHEIIGSLSLPEAAEFATRVLAEDTIVGVETMLGS
jgi:phosphotransferase system enzyme I (PtsP)